MYGGVVFREKQRMKSGLVWALVAFMAGLGIYAFIVQIIMGTPFGNNPTSDLGVVLLTVFTSLGLPLFFLLYSLTVSIDDEGVHINMLKWRHIPFEEIESYHAQRFNWLKDYQGVGIRLGHKGTGYIVGGSTGVMLHLKGGKKLLVESAQYEDMIQSLSMVMRKGPSTPQGFEEDGAARI